MFCVDFFYAAISVLISLQTTHGRRHTAAHPVIDDGKGCIQGTVITHVQLCLKLKYRVRKGGNICPDTGKH